MRFGSRGPKRHRKALTEKALADGTARTVLQQATFDISEFIIKISSRGQKQK